MLQKTHTDTHKKETPREEKEKEEKNNTIYFRQRHK